MKAIYGHLATSDSVLAEEVRRLRARVRELEAEVLVLGAEVHTLRSAGVAPEAGAAGALAEPARA